MAAGSTRAFSGSPGLTGEIQTYLGKLLGQDYAARSAAEDEITEHLRERLDQLTAVLAAQANRDAQIFRRDLEALFPNLRRFSLSLTRNPSEAEDLVQQTLMKAWRYRSSFAPGTNLGAWLFTIMRNNFLSEKRRNRFESRSDYDGLLDDVSTIPDQLDRLDVQDVRRAIGELSLPMQRALVLVAIEGLSYEAAASRMQCEVGTVKSRVCRARQQLSLRLRYSAGDVGADHVTLSVVSGQYNTARP